MNQISSEGRVAVTFSGAGNMTSDGVNTYVYTFGNRLVSATRTGMTATYDYDSVDRRTKKIVNGVMKRTLWSGADELAELDVYGDGLRRFIPDGSGAMDGRLATVEANGMVYWHHTDHQGSVIATSNSAGQTVGVASYSPYGEFGSGQSAPPLGSPSGYTGRQYDVETGLYQYRARYYSPRLGQFLSSDPIGTKDDPNLYLYVGNDPVNLTDPTGRESQLICRIAAVIGLHCFVVVTNSEGTLRAQFSYGPQRNGGNPGALVETAGDPRSETRNDDRRTISGEIEAKHRVNLNDHGFEDDAVVAAGQRVDERVGTPSRPGPTRYDAVNHRPGYVNSNAGAAAVLEGAIPGSSNNRDIRPRGFAPGWSASEFVGTAPVPHDPSAACRTVGKC